MKPQSIYAREWRAKNPEKVKAGWKRLAERRKALSDETYSIRLAMNIAKVKR